jgi:hypothetical protein
MDMTKLSDATLREIAALGADGSEGPWDLSKLSLEALREMRDATDEP